MRSMPCHAMESRERADVRSNRWNQSVRCYNDNSSRSSSTILANWKFKIGAVMPPAVCSIWSQNCQPSFDFGNRCLMQTPIVCLQVNFKTLCIIENITWKVNWGKWKVIGFQFWKWSDICLMQVSIVSLQFNFQVCLVITNITWQVNWGWSETVTIIGFQLWKSGGRCLMGLKPLMPDLYIGISLHCFTAPICALHCSISLDNKINQNTMRCISSEDPDGYWSNAWNRTNTQIQKYTLIHLSWVERLLGIEPKRGLSPQQLQRCPLQFNPLLNFIIIVIAEHFSKKSM